MGIFDFFKRSPEERLRIHLRKGVDAAIKEALRGERLDPLFGGMLVQTVIATYFSTAKRTNAYKAINDTWSADQIVAEEEKRAFNKYLK